MREADPREEIFWGYQDVALVIGFAVAAFFGLSLVAGLLLKSFPALNHHQAALIVPLQFAIYAAVYLGLYLVFAIKYGKPVLDSLGWRRSRIALWVPIVAGVLLPFLLSAVIMPFHPPKVATPFDKFLTSPVWIWVLGVIAVSIGPWMEELVFRGLLQPLVSRSLGIAAGVVLTAVLFGALHAPEYGFAWQYAVSVGLAGVAFGAVRAWADSTLSSTLMHGTFNLVMFCGFLANQKV
jgi:membrane protease YdiL (CAAX protease family)